MAASALSAGTQRRMLSLSRSRSAAAAATGSAGSSTQRATVSTPLSCREKRAMARAKSGTSSRTAR